MKKSILVLFFYFLLSTIYSQQNSIWSLPPNYIFNNGILPFNFSLPTGASPNYTGTYGLTPNMEFTHNAMHDANGNLLFFIVGQAVYDATGVLIDYLDFVPDNELLIIPVPNDCQRYYIIGDEPRAFPVI